MTAGCLCNTVHQLAHGFDERKAKSLASDLNKHLAAIRSILSQSKTLTKDVRYQVSPHNHRTAKLLSVQFLNTSIVDQTYDRFSDDVDSFWQASTNDSAHIELRRRLSCVVIHLRSHLNADVLIPPALAGFVQTSNISEVRYAGKKYLKVARKLRDIGSILWLPLDVPSSTYERYLTLDDQESISHLQSLGLQAPNYKDFVCRLLSHQLSDPALPTSYYNLSIEYPDIIPESDHLLLLIHALGGSEVPVALLQSVRQPQRRWGDDGEIQSTSAPEFGLPVDLVSLMSDDDRLLQAIGSQSITKHVLEDGTLTWSLRPELSSHFSKSLTATTIEAFTLMAFRLLCFACPPCFEGNAEWSLHLKNAIWTLLERLTKEAHIPAPLRIPVVESLLYFSERDYYSIRRLAIERAKTLVRKSMPYHIHASVALFESIISRQGGDLIHAQKRITAFIDENRGPLTRLESAIRGRLHIAQLENKIQSYDDDVPSFVYKWEGSHPLSSLEIEVTRRLQGTATRFFQSIGDFHSARASLEQHLWLDETQPIRDSTRTLIIGKLADAYTELHEYDKAVEMLQHEIQATSEAGRGRRPYRRLLLALADAIVGQRKLDAADLVLRQVADVEPVTLDDISDQLLYMRRILCAARIAHERLQYEEAIRRWRYALERMQQLEPFRWRHKMTAAVIQLSIAHAHLCVGDIDACKKAWILGTEILKHKMCEYWIPVLVTSWLHRIVSEIYGSQGWPFRMMLPGKKADTTLPELTGCQPQTLKSWRPGILGQTCNLRGHGSLIVPL